MKVLVTGAAGYFGGAILPALVADPRVTEVVATDLVPPDFAHPKLTFVKRDLVTEGAEYLARECDALIHLAFAVERRPGVDVEALNVDTNRRLLTAAVAACDVVLFASSVMAYGLRDIDPGRLREDDPPAPARGFYYAEQKIAAEALLRELTPGAKARIVVARPTAVGGPKLSDARAALYRGRWMIMPRVPHPLRVQLLHEADLGAAFATLLHAPAGTYNVAPDDTLTTREVARMLGQGYLALPMGLCAAVLDLGWRAGRSLLDGAWVRTLAYPAQVVDNAKLRSLGWAPAFTTAQTVWATAGRRAPARGLA